MDLLVLLAFACSVLLGVGRGIDLAFYTDASTGFCTVGSVWWRYAALAVCLLLDLAAGRCAPSRPQALRRRKPAAAALAILAEASFLLAGGTRLFWQRGAGSVLRAVLEFLSAAWMMCLAAAWMRKDEWKAPAGRLYLAVAGGASLYWSVLARFMENSSSWHRTAETAMVWQYLAALVFLAALARALYLPGSADGKTLCAGGLCAFALCFCWQLPQTAAALWQAANGQLGTPQAGLYFGAALCFVGLLGGVCAAACLAGGNAKHAAVG